MAKGKGFAGMRSSSMDGSYRRINPTKELYCINEELHTTDVPSATFGYERVTKPSVTRRSSFSWSRRPSKKHFDLENDHPEEEEERVTKPCSSFSWSTRPGSKKHFDLEEEESQQQQEEQKKPKKKKAGIKSFLDGIMDSYKKIMQSAEDSNVHLGDLYPGNSMVAPVTPAASNRGIKYISPSPGVGRRSLGRVVEEASRER